MRMEVRSLPQRPFRFIEIIYPSPKSGDLLANLTATNEKGAKNTTSHTFNVNEPNPPAFFIDTPIVPMVGDNVIFAASKSFDMYEKIVRY
jgi:hypothetical protein